MKNRNYVEISDESNVFLIQYFLFQVRSDSMASVYSGAGEGRYGTVTVRGQVEFGLQYNYKAGALEILIKNCKDLAPVDVKRNRSDPYVKVRVHFKQNCLLTKM